MGSSDTFKACNDISQYFEVGVVIICKYCAGVNNVFQTLLPSRWSRKIVVLKQRLGDLKEKSFKIV